mmetsp:Transcript_11994/g.18523  ORF Transcript_11994/g.18523 Transcript_11994/m.18523 type:complete len:104 (-) Transcript_11994:1951-2262(-)
MDQAEEAVLLIENKRVTFTNKVASKLFFNGDRPETKHRQDLAMLSQKILFPFGKADSFSDESSKSQDTSLCQVEGLSLLDLSRKNLFSSAQLFTMHEDLANCQ